MRFKNNVGDTDKGHPGPVVVNSLGAVSTGLSRKFVGTEHQGLYRTSAKRCFSWNRGNLRKVLEARKTSPTSNSKTG